MNEYAPQTLSSTDIGLDEDRMSKTPPNRRGITFEVGAQLEARDSLKNWYSANIEKIDYEDEKVLIHYRQWSHRYDEWFDWTSPYLRPVERIQLRRQGLQDDCPVPGFHVHDRVLASWSDCRFYPAKVLSVNRDASYTVKFYDGVVQTVKGIHVKPYVRERDGGGGKPRSTDRNGIRKPPNRRDRRPQENGGSKRKRARRSASDQEEDSNTEDDDEDEWEERERDEGCKRKDSGEDGTKERALTVKQEEEEGAQQAEQNHLKVPVNDAEHLNGVKVEEENGPGEEGYAHRLNGGIKKEEVEITAEHKDQIDASPHNETKQSTESPNQTSQTVPGTIVSIAPTDEKIEQKAASQPESSKAEGQPIVKPIRKQGFHNPNRFSREPLYRVIKNQPPPVLSINLDHNPFKCSAPGCTKSFRKAKLLHYHMKYYHGEDRPMEDLSPTRSVQTRASEKQTFPTTLESPKRRRTISASMYSTVHNPYVVPPSPRGEVKTAGRRTSAPPAVNTQNQQQRALQREKSKENHLDRNGCKPQEKDGEKSGQDLALVKERDRLKDKKNKDFLRIKLKKKKKKKKAKSDEDSVSDWSTDSCGWSEEEYGEELDVTTPPMSLDSVTLETSEQEIVRCVCEVEEENDFMIQCEECLCWQHGTCMGLLEENVPEKYSCYICRDTPGQCSRRFWYDRDWLSNGHMYGLSFLEQNYSHQNAKKIAATHQLLGDVHHVVEVLNGLQLKMSVLQSQAHPDLRLWCHPWKRGDSYSGTDTVPSPMATDEDRPHSEVLSAALEKLSRATSASSSSSCSSPYQSFQDSYISSEHCYQKPRAYYPAVEQRLVVETRRGSELEDSLRSTEDLLEREQRYGGLLDMDKPKALNTITKASNGGCWSQAEVKQEEGVVCGGGGVQDSSGQCQQWQINLLDHIDAVQDEVTQRMDFIERELDVLESWLDYTGELEPPEPLARLPQLKQRVKHLLSELGKVQKIALHCST